MTFERWVLPGVWYIEHHAGFGRVLSGDGREVCHGEQSADRDLVLRRAGRRTFRPSCD
jgi:hypothetical protein